MTPSRTRKPVATLGRPRSEIYVAIAVSAGIVLATVLLVWLMRPGASGHPGSGGLFNRQARVTLWAILTLAALALGIWWALRGQRRPKRFRPWVNAVIVSVLIVAVAIILAIIWPGGLVKHYPSAPSVDTNQPSSTSTPATQPTATTKGP